MPITPNTQPKSIVNSKGVVTTVHAADKSAGVPSGGRDVGKVGAPKKTIERPYISRLDADEAETMFAAIEEKFDVDSYTDSDYPESFGFFTNSGDQVLVFIDQDDISDAVALDIEEGKSLSVIPDHVLAEETDVVNSVFQKLSNSMYGDEGEILSIIKATCGIEKVADAVAYTEDLRGAWFANYDGREERIELDGMSVYMYMR